MRPAWRGSQAASGRPQGRTHPGSRVVGGEGVLRLALGLKRGPTPTTAPATVRSRLPVACGPVWSVLRRPRHLGGTSPGGLVFSGSGGSPPEPRVGAHAPPRRLQGHVCSTTRPQRGSKGDTRLSRRRNVWPAGALSLGTTLSLPQQHTPPATVNRSRWLAEWQPTARCSRPAKRLTTRLVVSRHSTPRHHAAAGRTRDARCDHECRLFTP